MAKLTVPSDSTYYRSTYESLMGIDLTCDPSDCPKNRATDLLNVIPDPTTSNIVKRKGWRKLHRFERTPIYGFHYEKEDVDFVALSSGSLYVTNGADTYRRVLYGGNKYRDYGYAAHASIIPMNGKLYYQNQCDQLCAVSFSGHKNRDSLSSYRLRERTIGDDFVFFIDDDQFYMDFTISSWTDPHSGTDDYRRGISNQFTGNHHTGDMVYWALFNYNSQFLSGEALENFNADETTPKVIRFRHDGDPDGDGIYTFQLYMNYTNDETYVHAKYGSEPGKADLVQIDTHEYYDDYIPNVVISRNADGTGGTDLESVNALNQHRMISFLQKAGSANRTFMLYPPADRDDYLTQITKVETMNENGDWVETAASDYEIIYRTGETIYPCYSNPTLKDKKTLENLKIQTGIRFATAPQQIVDGQDCVRITFDALDIEHYDKSPNGDKTYYGRYNPIRRAIMSSSAVTTYGAVNMDRVFYVVDDNKIYYSAPNQPEYIPDDNYILVGDDAPIVGLHRKDGHLVAITQNSSQFAIFLIDGTSTTQSGITINADGTETASTDSVEYFSVRPTISGNGAVASKSFATLIDDPLFLAENGIFGITTYTTTSQTVIANRSELINPRLIKETGLDKAIACIWNSRFYVMCVNNHCYLLDVQNTHKNRGVSYGYECYYWENIPAVSFLSYDGNLFFGTEEGDWCRLNTDITDGTAYNDDGVAIPSKYALKIDSDGYPMYCKNLTKKGTVVELLPTATDSIKLSYSKNGDAPVVIGDVTIDPSNEIVERYYPKQKVKKYSTLQFILENNKLNESMGIIRLSKTYTIGNFAKK